MRYPTCRASDRQDCIDKASSFRDALPKWSFSIVSAFDRVIIPQKNRNDYDEETAYECYMNPEPGFQSGPGDSANAD